MSSKLNKNIYLFNISLVLLIIGFALHYVNFFSKTNAIGNININVYEGQLQFAFV